MEFAWDERKRKANLAKHKIDLADAAKFEFELAIVTVDDRFDYGETRYRALGFIGVVLHALVFTEDGDTIRAISLRKAVKSERTLFQRVKRGTS